MKWIKKKKYIVIIFFVTLTLCSYYYTVPNIDNRLISLNENMEMKYILVWTHPLNMPLFFMDKGQDIFIRERCPVNNCYATLNKTQLNDITDFDAILFYGPELYRRFFLLPTKRSQHQKYGFTSEESSGYYPLKAESYERYFNWTLTYKLNSDVYLGYIIIKSKKGEIIGPKEVMHWLKVEDMEPIDNELIDKLRTKKKAVAWFVSNCYNAGGRNKVVKQLRKKLAKHNMTLDIYGRCGKKQCPKMNMANCLHEMGRDYYFYLSFENSFSEDYVTEKLLNALQHYTVPIVYGGANYTRFLPDGTYLNARTLKITKLVEQMVDIINHKEKYYNFFRWHNHYSYHHTLEAPDTNYICTFCRLLNDALAMKQISSHDNFSEWWNC